MISRVALGVASLMVGFVVHALFYYAVQPMPGLLVAKQIMLNALGCLLLGIAAAGIHRSSKSG